MYKLFSNGTFVLENKHVIILHQSAFIAILLVQSIFLFVYAGERHFQARQYWLVYQPKV